MKRMAYAAMLLVAGAATSCRKDDVVSERKLADASVPDASHRPLDPFTRDCSSARWNDVSDVCWSCLCTTCADTLNKCNDDCLNLLWCDVEKHALVNVGTELACEVRASAAECSGEPNAAAEDTNITNLDVCLIFTPKPDGGGFRACEAECNITYSGDVCARYPG